MISASSAAFNFIRTYVLESDLSPTWTTVRAGLYLGLASCVFLILALILSRIAFAMALPSILPAAMIDDLLDTALKALP